MTDTILNSKIESPRLQYDTVVPILTKKIHDLICRVLITSYLN